MKKRFSTWIRAIRNLRRPSASANRRRLAALGIDPARISVRRALPADAGAIARVHVQAFAETHGGLNPPTFALRHRQWTELLHQTDRFCYLAENERGEVAGFASGNGYFDPALPEYDGQLNKIYLLQTYQRLGIGRQLLLAVARRLYDDGARAMLLFGEAENPSCFFYEKMGGVRLLSPDGSFHGGYGWPSLASLLR
ncbi:GNAT family N-acetyltransferase [Siphonobacter aquaeclarae]|uniref:L-amino acid N-acyltransferase YncA n=1 Tax=Siphonobacter aquaeclarae TaxID=563176 RepID=A0A1G9HWP0_9BACT|nr:GNAT family N-acetyltransferase [Siphonobacter aquaeclarae]SDL17282.1 L-amino acid N-acyltransferase YncA [Siphonobacter aquaeclarae]